MSGRHKFSELEARMTPQRRARIDRMTQKLGAELDRRPPAANSVNYKRLHELSGEFTQLWNKLHALFLDSIVGFAFVCRHVEARQAQVIELLADTEVDSEEFQNTMTFTYTSIFSDDTWTARIHKFTDTAGARPKQGEVKARNSPDEANFTTLGQLCLVSFYDFWNDYLRCEYVIAMGLLDPNERDNKVIKERLREHASHDLWGDLSYLRNSIVHKQGNREF